jgi:hypothetical protein
MLKPVKLSVGGHRGPSVSVLTNAICSDEPARSKEIKERLILILKELVESIMLL